MPGRIAQRNTETANMLNSQRPPPRAAVGFSFEALGMLVLADICDNCGVLYAYEARKLE